MADDLHFCASLTASGRLTRSVRRHEGTEIESEACLRGFDSRSCPVSLDEGGDGGIVRAVLFADDVAQRGGAFPRKALAVFLPCLVDNPVDSLPDGRSSEVDDKPNAKSEHLQVGSALCAEPPAG